MVGNFILLWNWLMLLTNVGEHQTQNINLLCLQGGEPLLQLDQAIIDAVKSQGFEIAIETNGTIKVPTDIDWVCLSPKLNSQLLVLQADEIKLIWPQPNCLDTFEKVLSRFEKMSFKNYFIQPLDDANRQENTNLAIKICQLRPKWRLSLQTHKYLGIR